MINDDIKVNRDWMSRLTEISKKVEEEIQGLPDAVRVQIGFRTSIWHLLGYASSAETLLKYLTSDNTIADAVEDESGGGVKKEPKFEEFKKPAGRKSSASDAVKEKILTLLEKGEKAGAIAQKLGVNVQLVYNTKSLAKRTDKYATKKTPSVSEDLEDDEDEEVKVRNFKCDDHTDCGVVFKKNTSHHVASCPSCGMGASEVK